MDYKDFEIQNGAENHFWYKARRELLNNLFGLVFKDYNNNRLILEIGCGTGYQILALQKWGRVEGLDINSQAIAVAKKNGLNVYLGDIENMEISKDNYEAICLFDVLEHLKDDISVIQKAYVSLKKEGTLFLTVPAFDFMFSDHDRAMEHFRRYDRKEILQILTDNGFKIIKNGYWNCLLFPGVLAVRLFKNFLHLFIKKNSYNPESAHPQSLLNELLYRILIFENFLIKSGARLPFGLSIFIVAKKV